MLLEILSNRWCIKKRTEPSKRGLVLKSPVHLNNDRRMQQEEQNEAAEGNRARASVEDHH